MGVGLSRQTNTSEEGNGIFYNTEVLKSNFCDCNDAYILVKYNITVASAPLTQGLFKDCAPFTECISKIDRTTIDNAKDLDLVMLTYNLINIVQIALKQQEVYSFILKIKQQILIIILKTLIILNISSITLNYLETKLFIHWNHKKHSNCFAIEI